MVRYHWVTRDRVGADPDYISVAVWDYNKHAGELELDPEGFWMSPGRDAALRVETDPTSFAAEYGVVAPEPGEKRLLRVQIAFTSEYVEAVDE